MKIERPQITLVQCRFEFSGAKMALLGVKVWQINGISSNCQLSTLRLSERKNKLV